MTWTPPESLEEKLKRLLVPGGLYIRYLAQKEQRRGEREIGLIPFLADPRRVSLDVGANKGVYTHALLPHSAAVHAFEPNPKLFRILSGWARGRATLHDLALGDTTGEADLLVPRYGGGYSNQGGSLSAVKVTGEHGSLPVRTARLDDLDLGAIGFIKIDVEGFEMQVVAGAAETLRRDRPSLLIEIEERHTHRPLEESVADVCAHGYRCLALVGGVLTPFERIDLDRHHRRRERREDYVFNFIFLPV